MGKRPEQTFLLRRYTLGHIGSFELGMAGAGGSGGEGNGDNCTWTTVKNF